MNSSQSPISRRALAKGSAWSAPVILTSSAIPAYAASPRPTLTSITWFYRANGPALQVKPYTCTDRVQIQIIQNSKSYITLSNLASGSTLSNLTASYWLPVETGTTFSRVSGTSTCWSVPTASGRITTNNGFTYREYVSNYTCPITASGSSWTQPTSSNFNFVSSCQTTRSLATNNYHYEQNITVTSKTGQKSIVTKENGWANAMVA